MATPTPNRDEILKELKRYKSEKNYDGMLSLAQYAVMNFPEDSKIWDFLHFAQAHYVNEKLESQIVKQLEERKDWNALAQVYQKLLTIFPESHHLKKLLKKTHILIQKGHEAELRAFYENAGKKVEDLIETGDFESAIAACYEMLSQEPENKHFIRLLVRAQARLDDQMNRELEEYYKEVIPALRMEYKQHKEDFIRI